MKYQILFISIIGLFFTACSVKPLEPIKYKTLNTNISYEQQIKPILDNRCVACHSCYNSACQLKLSSYDGLLRGSSKDDVYANRLNAADPTRLFVDAINEEQWRNKGFHSVTKKEKNSSLMMDFLNQKNLYPKSKGIYSPEKDELTCAKNKNELAKYFEKNPNHGMPYGFPALKEQEYNLLMTWLNKGAVNDTKIKTTSKKEKELIKNFEDFFNKKNIKHQVTARYIYEHLFLAHISFDDKSGNFYELIRSKTPSGEKPHIIATRFPYDEIKEEFYYRFRKIESTIVHKTHMVYKLNKTKLLRYKELFIKATWDEKPYIASYDKKIVANALKVFEQIPAKSRYNFLLDDIHYIIMTFIRGPVCKGQIALNVIQDHFWVMFLDPKYDLSLKHKYFLHDNLDNLNIPNQYGDDPNLLKTLSILDNYKLAKQFNENKSKLYSRYYPNGIGLESLWKGNQDDQVLTIYRHFDSASVHKGALGNIPRTLWIIDFPLLERIYYSLVAGFDVFGNTTHQLLVRKHMDRLRIEGESNFLNYLPKQSRKKYFDSWYEGWLASNISVYYENDLKTKINYLSDDYKKEFILKSFKHLEIKKDKINFVEKYTKIELKKVYNSKEEIEKTLSSFTKENSSKLIQHFNNGQSNLAFLRIKMKNKKDLIYTMVINRWLDNVSLLFNEKARLDSQKDTINFIEGFVGSYPNIFIHVNQDDLYDFFTLLKDYDDSENHKNKLLKFSINRANPNFWKSYDWFNKKFKEQDSLNYGIFDLNRYYDKAINNKY